MTVWLTAVDAHRPRPATAGPARSVPALVLVLLSLALGGPVPGARAAPALRWSAPSAVDVGHEPRAVSCASEALCAAVDAQGGALVSFDPTAASPTWTRTQPDGGGAAPSAVSCVPSGPCVAVDDHGNALVTPAGSTSWSVHAIDEGRGLTGVSCPGASLCVAVDEAGRVLTSTNPAGTWTPASIDPEHPQLTGVSCAFPSLCVAVDQAGDVLTSTNPSGGAGAWHAQRIAGAAFSGVSCVAGTSAGAGAVGSGACVAVDGAGEVLASAGPAGSGANWTLTPVEPEALSAVSCAESGVCVAVDGRGEVLGSDDPQAALPTWGASRPSGEGLASISCLPGGSCIAVTVGGSALLARVGAPVAVTLPPSEVTATSAIVVATVDPNDAVLGACRFEYGTSLAYGQLVPCSVAPIATGGAQSVSAQIPELSPATGYHVRIAASSPSGLSEGADVTFSTPTSSAVPIAQPHPSIGGTPAPGQTLSCHANLTPSGVTAHVTFAWLRDLIPVTGTSASTFAVKGRDSGHHLQCQVTAVDGGGTATAKSAFVTVPVSGAPAATGETQVGLATFRAPRIGVPVRCAPQAPSGCQVSLRLTVIETLQGRRVVAVSARRGRGVLGIDGVARRGRGALGTGGATRRGGSAARRGGGAALRRVTATLASASMHVSQGAYVVIGASLSAAGRRLLKARHSVPGVLYVTGTVIGVIQAQLSTQHVTLTSGTVGRAGRRARVAGAPANNGPLGGAGGHGRPGRADTPAGRRTGAGAEALGGGPRSARAASTATEAAMSATPYMGWDTYFAFGGDYSESTVLRQASQLVSLGLQRLGYRYIWLDVGWWHGAREANGQIAVSAKQWPHGLSWLTRTLHAAGFLVGLYTDAGPDGCGGAGQGSFGHYQQDVETFAAWGFDAVKVDFCGGSELGLNPAAAYTAFHQAIAADARHRPMLLSICNFLEPEQAGEGLPSLSESAFSSFTFGPGVGNSWRTDTDVGFPGDVSFASVLRNIDADAAAPQAAGPGHWNDPDYLAPDQGMSATQFRSQLSMWAMLAAPLMVSDDLTKVSSASLAALRNREVIALDQDPAGVQGTLLAASASTEVWVKPLVDGSRAVALLNRGSHSARIETSAGAVGLGAAAAGYTVRDLWSGHTSVSQGRLAAQVPGDGTVLLRVWAR